MFRDTFAVELLKHGVSLETVSMYVTGLVGRHVTQAGETSAFRQTAVAARARVDQGHREALQAVGKDAPGQARSRREKRLAGFKNCRR